MRRRKDPPGYPGDEYITQRFYEMKDALRESAGMTREELEKAIVAACENSLQHTAPIRRAMGTRIRAEREKRNLTRAQLAGLTNVPAREIGRIERGTSEIQLGDMVRLCLGLKYDIRELTKDISGMLGQDGK
jgi:DNA-binding XRE family transcriptional regulator